MRHACVSAAWPSCGRDERVAVSGPPSRRGRRLPGVAVAQEVEQGVVGRLPARPGLIDSLSGRLLRCVAGRRDGAGDFGLRGIDLRAQRSQLAVVLQSHACSIVAPAHRVFARCQGRGNRGARIQPTTRCVGSRMALSSIEPSARRFAGVELDRL
jgi:hypothetical protein